MREYLKFAFIFIIHFGFINGKNIITLFDPDLTYGHEIALDIVNVPGLSKMETNTPTTVSKKLSKTRLPLFADAFVKEVKSLEHLSLMFDVTLSPEIVSSIYFQAWNEALLNANVSAPNALARTLADAVLSTYSLLTQDKLVYALATITGLIVYAEDKLTLDNAVDQGVDFAKNVLGHFAKIDGYVTQLAINRGFAKGMVDFFNNQGIYAPGRVPAFILSTAKHLFAMTGIRQATEISDSIFSGNAIYGVMGFTRSFLNIVKSSESLNNVFNVNESALVVSKAWSKVIIAQCPLVNCEKLYVVEACVVPAIEATFNDLTPDTYAVGFANGFAMYLLTKGYLDLDNSLNHGETFARIMGNRAKSLKKHGDVIQKTEILLDTIREFSETILHVPYAISQFGLALYYCMDEFHCITGITRKPFF